MEFFMYIFYILYDFWRPKVLLGAKNGAQNQGAKTRLHGYPSYFLPNE
jgi:hypothetical protein